MMKKNTLLLIIAVMSAVPLFAQGDIVRIKPGEDPAVAYSPHGFYRFPAFTDGVAFFKNGTKTTARFNYHMFNQEIQFITFNGDTLAVADPFSIKYLTIDSVIFYFSDGYLEVIENNENLKLATRVRLEAQWEKIGAYGQASPSGSIRNPNKLILGNNGKDLSLNQNMLIRKDFTFFWVDKFGTAFKANKANLFKITAPDSRSAIEDYLKHHKTDFTKEVHLRKLVQYINTNAPS